ncbi:glycosyltransferase family 4 protein [Mitsuaria sp. BK037]|uniref:glycosyltransferase family 4 protein n=1 Tax=unclassified Roseateles TaxID=2626991 RepID=UPI0016080FFC|nr:glycosyltransferase family 4 protein [Mitsuaria sp. BK037]MBB3282893.1 glycosyltransferase involved in cell wall biosynthesis [Mitsuaria sp. BK037]
MKLLLINHYAGSPKHGMEFRPFYLAREWVRAGHQALILGASYSHVRTTQPEPGMAAMSGVNYLFYDTPEYQGNGMGRVKNIWSFCRQVWKDADILAREFAPDVVIASSTYPMDVWVARRVAKLAKAKLVYEVHDLWPLSPIELSGMSKWHPFAMLCQKAENDAYRDADVVVSMLPKVHAHMAAHGLDLKKLHIVPNGITLDEWSEHGEPLEPAIQAHLDAERAAGRTVVGYAGSMGEPNALDVLLDAAKLLKERADPAAKALSVVLVGGGHLREHLEARVRDEAIGNVAMFPAIPKAQIPSLLKGFDIAYIGWQRTPIYRFGIAPNKLMDYLMAQRPVLHSVEAGNDPVAEAGAGLTVPPQDPKAVADGLLTLAAVPAGERAEMGRRGREFVLANHTYPVLAQRFIDAVS